MQLLGIPESCEPHPTLVLAEDEFGELANEL